MSDGVDGAVAVVEIGSGSVKLLVADASSVAGGRPDLVRRSVKTRLWAGDGVNLAPERLADTAAAFEGFAADIGAAGAVAPPSVIATAVAREVGDLGPLEDLVGRVFGSPIEVLSPAREAELAFAGATAGRQLPGPLSLLDIGAGSTELATTFGAGPAGPGGAVPTPGATPAGSDGATPGAGAIRSASLAIGARVLTDGYLHRDPPGPDELSSALSVAELHYDDLRRDLPELRQAVEVGTVIGVGAVEEIAAVEIGRPDPDESIDGHVLTKPAVEEVFRTLATESAEDRAFNPGLRPEHVDDIVGALCVLVEFLRRFDVAELVVSERSLRHGRAAELLASN